MNVLLVGNGFDRKLGLKTDYISFLDWMKENGFGVGEKFNALSKKIYTLSNPSNSENRLSHYKKFSVPPNRNEFLGDSFSIKNYNSKYFEESEENFTANSLLYLLPEIVSPRNIAPHSKAPNIWYVFIQLLRYEKKNRIFNLNIKQFEPYIGDEGNWVDLEGLIQKSIKIRIQQDYYKNGVFSVSRYFDVFSLANLLCMDTNTEYQNNAEDIYNIVWTDFLDFKKSLTNYLTPIVNTAKIQWLIFEEISKQKTEDKAAFDFSNFEIVINFNYTNYTSKGNNIYYVHGSIDDRANVVFGLEMNIRGDTYDALERKTQFEISLHKNKQLLKFSKISQLLHLQADKEFIKLEKIKNLTIVGHSIGEQDYSYYFSILDRNANDILIVCLWYEYNNGGDNKETMKEALFEMLTSYEKYSNQKILHKMIFEGRIKFRKVFIPQLFAE